MKNFLLFCWNIFVFTIFAAIFFSAGLIILRAAMYLIRELFKRIF